MGGGVPTAAILGLGIVGRSMALLAPPGTIGIDIDPARVELCRASGGEATTDPDAARGRELLFLCVGTPMGTAGLLDATQFYRVLKEVEQLASAETTTVIRSTILPTLLGACARLPGPVVVNPEFLRVRSAVREVLHPPFLIVGAEDPRHAAPVMRWWKAAGLARTVPRLLCTRPEALALKYACNWFHALKVEFGNLMGDVCRTWGADAAAVMAMFVQDSVLNISPAYLKPGGPFGGACLPKDLYAGLAALKGKPLVELALLRALAEANVRRGGPSSAGSV